MPIPSPTYRRPNTKREEQLLEWRREGVTWKEIAERLNISVSWAREMYWPAMRRAGLVVCPECGGYGYVQASD